MILPKHLMKKVVKQTTLPAHSHIAEGFGSVDYLDVFQIRKATPQSAKEIANEIFRLPAWVKTLLALRNRIVAPFGLKTDKYTSPTATFFPSIESREEELVMGEDDQHLNFRASILKNTSESTVSLITVVHFNNRWGKLYFLPVKPFHHIIMKTLLKKYLKDG